MLDLRPVLLVTGALLAGLGAFMLVPALVGLANQDRQWPIFVTCGLVTMLVGLSLFAATRGTPKALSTRQAMLTTVVSWLALVCFASLPLVWSGTLDSYTDAFFEAMAGLTTTGATVMVGLDTTPMSVLFSSVWPVSTLGVLYRRLSAPVWTRSSAVSVCLIG